MWEKLQELKLKAEGAINACTDIDALNEQRVALLGKKGLRPQHLG